MTETLTTGHGAPVADKLNSMTAGPRGPLLIQVEGKGIVFVTLL